MAVKRLKIVIVSLKIRSWQFLGRIAYASYYKADVKFGICVFANPEPKIRSIMIPKPTKISYGGVNCTGAKFCFSPQKINKLPGNKAITIVSVQLISTKGISTTRKVNPNDVSDFI